MDEDDDAKALEELRHRLKSARGEGDEAEPKASSGAMAQGYRQATELIVATLVGAFLGFWLDRWLNSSPAFLISLFLLGMITGVRNMLRSAETMNKGSSQDD